MAHRRCIDRLSNVQMYLLQQMAEGWQLVKSTRVERDHGYSLIQVGGKGRRRVHGKTVRAMIDGGFVQEREVVAKLRYFDITEMGRQEVGRR